MEIHILGTRGEVEPSAPYHSRHSGVLVDDVLLLDVGEKEFLGYQPEYVFITHLHPDHAFFVTDPCELDASVYAPETSPNLTHITVITEAVEVDSYRVTPIPTHHSKYVKSMAYLIESGNQRLLYTGDLIWINKEYHHLLEGLSLVITDGSFIRKGGFIRKDRETGQLYGHTGIPDLIHLFQRFTQHILFVHFGNWFYKDARGARRTLEKLGKASGVAVYVGYDGMKLDIDATGLRHSRHSLGARKRQRASRSRPGPA